MLTLKIPRYFEVLISIHCIPGLVAEAFHPDLDVYTPDELARIRYDFANRFYAEIEEASMNGSMRIRNRIGRVIDPKNFRNLGDVHTDWNTVAPHDLIDYLKDLDPVIVFIEPPANTATQPASDAHKQASATAASVAAQQVPPVESVAALIASAALPKREPDDKALANWKMRIQVEATSYFLRLRANGASPTVHSMLDDLVIWCRANDVKTDGGIFPSAGYLRTHVLGGKHWEPPR
jgi:hypothetical protein